MSRHTIV